MALEWTMTIYFSIAFYFFFFTDGFLRPDHSYSHTRFEETHGGVENGDVEWVL